MINNNQVDDDNNDLARALLNQRQNVLSSGGLVPTNTSSINTASGTIANPGAAGYGGDDRPGRRLYNPLSKFASSTYQITWYLLTPEAYQKFVDSGRKKIDAFPNPATGEALEEGGYIIAQSGGIPTYKTELVAGAGGKTEEKDSIVNRPPGFKYDFFIDNLKFNTSTSSKATGTSTSVTTDIQFQIIEPYGFTFPTSMVKLNQSVYKLANKNNQKVPTNVWKNFFVLGIRFTGYDAEGNIIKPTSELNGEPIDPVGADGALFENFYDFTINEFKFKLDGKTVVYNIKGGGTNGTALLSVKRGRLPTGSKISGSTVDDMLQGPKGLLTHLNEYQQELLNSKTITVPNTYKVVYMGDAQLLLGSASMATEADLNKWLWPGNKSKNTKDSNDAAGQKSAPNNTQRELQVNNDESIIQTIETIIKKSSFMVDALKTTYTNTVQPDVDQKNNQQIANPEPIPFKWYNISAQISKAEWDDKIKDWAYDTTYVISLYEIHSIETPYVKPGAGYPGAYKRYEYMWTGQNREVIELNMDFNLMHYNDVLSIDNKSEDTPTTEDSGSGRPNQEKTAGSGSGSATGNTKATANNRGMTEAPPPPNTSDNSAGTATQGGAVSVKPGTRAGGNKTGGLGTSMEAQNSVVTNLQDPNAYAYASLKIMGDPDFLIRDAASSLQELYNKYYDLQGDNNFVINAQGGQVFIEVAIKEAVDYDYNSQDVEGTGLLVVNENILFQNYPKEIRDQAKGAIIWQVNSVQSSFQLGKFEQILSLSTPSFEGTTEIKYPTEDATNGANNKTKETNPDAPGKPTVDPQPRPNPAPTTPAASTTPPPKNTATSAPPANSDPEGLYGRD